MTIGTNQIDLIPTVELVKLSTEMMNKAEIQLRNNEIIEPYKLELIEKLADELEIRATKALIARGRKL